MVTPAENAESQGEIGSNLESDMPVDTIVTTRANRDHPVDNIIGDPNAGVRTRSRTENSCLFVAIKEMGIINQCLHSCFISQVQPKNILMALKYGEWVEAMQEE